MPDSHGDTWRITMQRRLAVVAAVAACWAALVQVRLVDLQVVQHEELTSYARQQQTGTVEVPAPRGDITDRHGRVLAYTVRADTVWADPKIIEDASKTIAELCAVLDCTARDRLALERRLSDKRRRWEPVRRFVPPDVAERVRALELPGIDFKQDDRRYYPNRELGAHVIGYVGTEHKGLGGIEAAYDEVLRGQPGRMRVQTDGAGVTFNSRVELPPTAGATIELTIDEPLQHILDRELRRGVEENAASSGMAIVLQPATGEVLAMSSYPTFNPNAFGQASDEVRRNRAVQDTFEPGSTFKVVTAAAALDSGQFRPDSPVDGTNGKEISGTPLDNFGGQDFGTIDLATALTNSVNTAWASVAEELGKETMGEYMRKFGFFEDPPMDYPDEQMVASGEYGPRGRLLSPTSDQIDVGRMAIGQDKLQVTPLQMASVAQTVANGGVRMEPRLVERIVDPDGRTIDEPLPEEAERVMSEENAQALASMMRNVVEQGTGTAAQLEGVDVSGKTGTAEVGDGTDNLWFIGFTDTVAVAVMLERQTGGTGGGNAAPIAADVLQALGE